MDAKQFAWLYLIENGKAGCSPSYYGGYDLDKDCIKIRTTIVALRSDYLVAIKSVGVDWKNTGAPQSDIRSVFNGTFADDTQKEYIEGYLILNDGSKQHWIADAIEVTNVFEMMAAVSAAPAKFNQYFGE